MRSLSYNNLRAAGAAALAPALAANGSLTSLNLAQNQLCGLDEYGDGTYTAEGITAIADALRVNGALSSLDLSKNHLCGIHEYGNGTYNADCITAIADALFVNGALTALNLSSNWIGGHWDGGYIVSTPEGPKAIADALRVNGVLTALDLSSNYLKDEGVSAVCEAIQSNKETKLASLNFFQNNIGPVGANALVAMVAVTGALTKMRYVTPKLERIWVCRLDPFVVRAMRNGLCTSLAFAFASSALV